MSCLREIEDDTPLDGCDASDLMAALVELQDGDTTPAETREFVRVVVQRMFAAMARRSLSN